MMSLTSGLPDFINFCSEAFYEAWIKSKCARARARGAILDKSTTDWAEAKLKDKTRTTAEVWREITGIRE